MQIEIRDYRGVERASIVLDRIALVAGRNEQGKSCVAEATRAALCAMPIPIPGVLKKDAKVLVRDGCELGEVKATMEMSEGEAVQGARWPQAKLFGDGEIMCSTFAGGFERLMDLPLQARSMWLAKYIDSEPSEEDVAAAAADAGYGENAVAKIWQSIQLEGWDGTYKKTRNHTTKLKGQWEEAAGEKYGAKKAEGWEPEGYVESDRPTLEKRLEKAEAAVLAMAGAVAVDEDEKKRLNAAYRESQNIPTNLMDLNNELNDIRELQGKQKEELAAIPADPGSKAAAKPQTPCPACGVALTIVRGNELEEWTPPEEPDPERAKKLKARRDKVQASIDESQVEIDRIEKAMTEHQNIASAGAEAKKRLDEIKKAPKLDEAALEQAKDDVGDARSALDKHDRRERAHKLHRDLQKNDKLVEILAPEGLRRRRLAEGLGKFNELLNFFSTTAGWPLVRLDENLECWYGDRPLWAASKSGQWRAHAIIQIVMAVRDDSSAVIIDEADMLDNDGRNGLFAALGASELRALVCMTFNRRDQVPNLGAAGMGQAYWIKGGIAEKIE